MTMRVFISSVVEGFESYRRAAAAAVEDLGYTVVRAEDLPARPETPRRACLEAARDADLTVVLLGARYGTVQDSGLSATHEEFREAREHGPVAVFVQQGVEPEAAQAELIAEAEEWATGRLTKRFTDVDQLRSKVTRTLHDFVVSRQAGPVDTESLVARARELVPRRRGGSAARLHLAISGGPRREVLPPAMLEDESLAQSVTEQALFGPQPVLDSSEGTRPCVSGDALVLEQDTRSIQVTEDGAIRITVPAVQPGSRPAAALPVLVEEDVGDALAAMIGFGAWLLDEIDPNRRLSELAVLAALENAGYMGWKTRAEVRADPHRASMSMRGDELVVVPDDPRLLPRPALSSDRDRLARDLAVRLRRELRR